MFFFERSNRRQSYVPEVVIWRVERRYPGFSEIRFFAIETNFRGFFRPATLKISSLEIYSIRLVRKFLFLSFNLSDMRVKSALWVPQIGVRHEINTFWQSIHLKFIRAWTWCGSHVDWRDGDWRTIYEHFCVPQAFWAWGFLKMIWYQTKHTQNIDIRI